MVHCGVFVLNAMPGLLGGILHVFALYALDFRHLHNKRGLLFSFFSADVVKPKLFSVTSKYVCTLKPDTIDCCPKFATGLNIRIGIVQNL